MTTAVATTKETLDEPDGLNRKAGMRVLLDRLVGLRGHDSNFGPNKM